MRFKIENLIAGTLRQKLSQIDTEGEATDLRIEGELNEEDMTFLKLATGKNGKVNSLDLSKATGIEKIDRYSFEQDCILKTLKTPISLKTIGWGALSMCEKLSSVILNSGLERIENFAFNGCKSLKAISIPSSVNHIGQDAFGACSSLDSIKIPLTNKNYISDNGIIYSKNGKTLIKYPSGKSETTFIIPSDVECIAQNAFFMCENLKSIILPESLETIEDRAFCSCSNLQSITLPKGIRSLGKNIFACCDSLLSVFSQCEIPPMTQENNDNNKTLSIYVPLKSLDSYKQSEVWNNMGKIYGK